MSNIITIELCAEDRARLDRLAVALERHSAPTVTTDPDPIQKAAAEALAGVSKATESPENATETAEEETPATTPKAEEKLTEDEALTAQDILKLRADVRSLVIQISAKGKKAEARAASIEPYGAKSLPDIPEDKLFEVKGRLTELWARVKSEG